MANLINSPFMSDDYAEAMTAAIAGDNPAESLLEQLGGMTAIENEAQAALVTDIAKVLKTASARIAAELKKITGPLREAEAAARAVAKRSSDPLDEGEKRARALLQAWVARQREIQRQQELAREQARKDAELQRARQQEEQLARARVEAEGELPLPPETAPAPAVVVPEVTATPTTRGAVGTSSARRTAKVEVLDVAKAAQAMPHLFKLDGSAARDAFKDQVRRELVKGFHATGTTPTDAVAEEAAIAAFAEIGLRAWYEDSVAIR